MQQTRKIIWNIECSKFKLEFQVTTVNVHTHPRVFMSIVLKFRPYVEMDFTNNGIENDMDEPFPNKKRMKTGSPFIVL